MIIPVFAFLRYKTHQYPVEKIIFDIFSILRMSSYRIQGICEFEVFICEIFSEQSGI